MALERNFFLLSHLLQPVLCRRPLAVAAVLRDSVLGHPILHGDRPERNVFGDADGSKTFCRLPVRRRLATKRFFDAGFGTGHRAADRHGDGIHAYLPTAPPRADWMLRRLRI